MRDPAELISWLEGLHQQSHNDEIALDKPATNFAIYTSDLPCGRIPPLKPSRADGLYREVIGAEFSVTMLKAESQWETSFFRQGGGPMRGSYSISHSPKRT